MIKLLAEYSAVAGEREHNGNVKKNCKGSVILLFLSLSNFVFVLADSSSVQKEEAAPTHCKMVLVQEERNKQTEKFTSPLNHILDLPKLPYTVNENKTPVVSS